MKKPSLLKELVLTGFLPWPMYDIERTYYYLLERKLHLGLFCNWIKERKEEVLNPQTKLPLLFWAEQYYKWQQADQIESQ